MRLLQSKLLRENKTTILENLKQAKLYLQQGKLSQNDLTKLLTIDNTPTKKYMGWIAKTWIAEKPDFDDLANTIEQYNILSDKNKIKEKDINKFKNFSDLKQAVDDANQTSGQSRKELEDDYEVIIDNADLLIISPNTHEASRKLGLSKFAFRDCEGGEKDSAWCTTYKSPDHWNQYYYKNDVTFYYIRIISEKLQEKLKKDFSERIPQIYVTALALLPNGTVDGYDGLDKQLSQSEVTKFMDIIGIK